MLHVTMPPKEPTAALLAVVVFAYTTFACALECSSHRSHALGNERDTAPIAASFHHHGTADAHADHHCPSHEHDKSSPIAPACCHSSLYSVVFQSLSPVEVIRSQASATPPWHGVSLSFPIAPGMTRCTHPTAIGPPGATASAGPGYVARSLFLTYSSFLI